VNEYFDSRGPVRWCLRPTIMARSPDVNAPNQSGDLDILVQPIDNGRFRTHACVYNPSPSLLLKNILR
jgi:hypothetical protein